MVSCRSRHCATWGFAGCLPSAPAADALRQSLDAPCICGVRNPCCRASRPAARKLARRRERLELPRPAPQPESFHNAGSKRWSTPRRCDRLHKVCTRRWQDGLIRCHCEGDAPTRAPEMRHARHSTDRLRRRTTERENKPHPAVGKTGESPPAGAAPCPYGHADTPIPQPVRSATKLPGKVTKTKKDLRLADQTHALPGTPSERPRPPGTMPRPAHHREENKRRVTGQDPQSCRSGGLEREGCRINRSRPKPARQRKESAAGAGGPGPGGDPGIGAAPPPRRAGMVRDLARVPGAGPPWRSAWGKLPSRAVPFVGSLGARKWWSVGVTMRLALVLALANALFLVRLFMIQHDCGHSAFFPQTGRSATGRGAGPRVLTLTP